MTEELALSRAGFAPRNLDELWRLAEGFFKSGLPQKHGYTTEALVLAGTMVCLESGLPLSFVLTGDLVMIRNRPCLWGDAALGKVRESGLLEDILEEPILGDAGNIEGYRCTVKRKGQPTPIIRTFTVKDAVQAKLWDKRTRTGEPTPWITHPTRMLQMRARAFALRDGFSDVTKGLGVREEVQDYPDPEPAQPALESRTEGVKKALGVGKAAPEVGEVAEAPEAAPDAPTAADAPEPAQSAEVAAEGGPESGSESVEEAPAESESPLTGVRAQLEALRDQDKVLYRQVRNDGGFTDRELRTADGTPAHIVQDVVEALEKLLGDKGETQIDPPSHEAMAGRHG